MHRNILIISAGSNLCNEKLKEYINKSDYIICADGGYKYIEKNGIEPDLLVGDFDSLKIEHEFKNTITLPIKKDETDTLFALKKAFELNPENIIIYAGIGSRFDHSYANVCLLNMCLEKNIDAFVTDGYNRVYLIDNEMKLKNEKGNTLSIYSFSEFCEGVTLDGFEYSLENFYLEKYNILGTSNIIISDEASIKLSSGKLLIICNEKENI